jgi:hypothetical protein
MTGLALFLGIAGLACLVAAAAFWLRARSLRDLRKVSDLFRQDAEFLEDEARAYGQVGAMALVIAAAMWWTA